jgi:glutamine amidotransferase
MCRLILARGRVPVPSVVAAALAMSTGLTADHEGPIRCHPNGWGAVWRTPDSPTGLRAHRDCRSMASSVAEAPLAGLETDLLAVHVRHATLPHNHGLEFTHPLHRADGPVPWYFMHNGFLPTVHRALGLPASTFDSLEYFDYVVARDSDRLDPAATIARLRALRPGGSSGNAFAINGERSHVIHWSPEQTPYPRYFTMHRLELPDLTVFSSEIIPRLAPRVRWDPLPPGTVLDLPHLSLDREETLS